ncbi:MAG: hypothetical protein WCP21_13375, partial [Armatimonadota bacterium]
WAVVATHPIRPHDFWWHLAIGREIVATHHIPQADAFSYTAPGAPYPSYNVYWLADAGLYLAYAAGGPARSVFVHALIITLTYGFILVLCWRLSGSGRVAAFCTLAAAACGFENWNVRPQAIAFYLAALYLLLIYGYRRRPDLSWRWVLLFPLIMLVWVNCHGSFPLGIVLLGMWFLEGLGRPGRRWLLPLVALALTTPAMLLNPQGAGIFAYLSAMSHNPVVRQLPEWAPASLATKDGIAYFLLLAAALVLLGLSRRRLTAWHVLTFVGFAALAGSTGRAIIWFGMFIAPVLAELLGGMLSAKADAGAGPAAGEKAPDRVERIINGVLAAGLIALMLVTLPWFKDRLPMSPQKAGLISSETPVAATQYLLDHRLPPRLFADMAYGSYLIWAAQPQYKVFTDPRVELYSQSVWQQYETLSAAGPGWGNLLDRRGVNTLMLDLTQQAALVAAACHSPRWREVYRDQRTAILVRKAQ